MKNKRIIRILRVVSLAVFIVCLGFLARAYGLSQRHNAQINDLKERGEAAPELSDESPESDAPEGNQPEEPAVLDKYTALLEENADLVGWISIKGMKINYPVMQGEDDDYYLHHDFYGKESKYGCLFVKRQADIQAGTNAIVYGHNMKDGTMFGDLDLYQEKDFYQKHPKISFDTLYEERTYDIIAVFRSQVYDSDDDVFKYYEFYEAETEEEFNFFYRNIKKLSLYDTGVKARFGDTFLTLSTCAYHVEDGRFVVVAKRRRRGK